MIASMAPSKTTIGLRDPELLDVAAFFLKEVAARCRILADSAQAPSTRAELSELSRVLEAMIGRLGHPTQRTR